MEDGSPLILTSPEKDEILTLVKNKTDFAAAGKTLEFSDKNQTVKSFLNEPEKTRQTGMNPTNKIDEKLTNFKEKVSYQGLRTIEVLPIILALANNYWQWLYLNRANYGDTLSFLISINFFVWFLLLIFGLISCIIAVKYGKNRGLAITALVILAINLLLSIVPLK
jgi:hypothetical protein